MLHLHKLRADDLPCYVNGEFSGDYRWRSWAGGLTNAVTLGPEPTATEVMRLLRGEHLNRMHKAGGSRLAAVQLTVGAPKSVSIAGLVLGDQRVFAAQEQALLAMLSYAESLPFFRITSNKQTDKVRADRVLAAFFHRFASRSGDPHLHSHAIIFNAGLTEDGLWRAFEASNFWHEKFLLGAIYRSSLATLLTAHGYTVAWDDKGLFELVEVDQSLVQRFSSRRDQIEDLVFRVTRKTLGELGGNGTIPFAAASAPHLPPSSFEDRLKVWRAPLKSELQKWQQPCAVTQAINWGPSERAVEALREAYAEQRSAGGGCLAADMLLAAFTAAPNQLTLASLLSTFDEEVTGGAYHLWGEPRLAWSTEDYPLWLERTFGPAER